jgi:hypothetical protein
MGGIGNYIEDQRQKMHIAAYRRTLLIDGTQEYEEEDKKLGDAMYAMELLARVENTYRKADGGISVENAIAQTKGLSEEDRKIVMDIVKGDVVPVSDPIDYSTAGTKNAAQLMSRSTDISEAQADLLVLEQMARRLYGESVATLDAKGYDIRLKSEDAKDTTVTVVFKNAEGVKQEHEFVNDGRHTWNNQKITGDMSIDLEVALRSHDEAK